MRSSYIIVISQRIFMLIGLGVFNTVYVLIKWWGLRTPSLKKNDKTISTETGEQTRKIVTMSWSVLEACLGYWRLCKLLVTIEGETRSHMSRKNQSPAVRRPLRSSRKMKHVHCRALVKHEPRKWGTTGPDAELAKPQTSVSMGMKSFSLSK